MKALLSALMPLDRMRFLRAALMLVTASAAIVALGYAIAMPLDSMYVMMYAVIAAGAVFMFGGMALVWFRFRAMGYPPFPSMIAYMAAVYFAANLLTTRAFEAKLMAAPFVVGLLLPFVLAGRANRSEAQKNIPRKPGDEKDGSV